MHVFITGGAGYLGTALTDQLAQNPNIKKVTVYDNLSRANYQLFFARNKWPKNKVHFIQGDILDSRKLKRCLQSVDVVYHLAAKVTTPFADQNPHLFEQVNHWGTAELVYAIEESKVQQFYFLGSASVYGSGKDIKTEESPVAPLTYYGTSKHRAEAHVQRLSEHIPAYIIRCGNIYGYNRSLRFDAVINRFMFEAHINGRITIQGTGEQHRPFIHVDRAAKHLVNMLDAPQLPGIYNLAEQNLAVGEIAHTIKEIYPELEFLFVNQHLEMLELQIKPSNELNTFNTNFKEQLMQDLKDFQTYFSN